MKAETTLRPLFPAWASTAHEVHPAALTGGAEHLGDCRIDALVRVRDHQFDAAQTTPCQLAQELGPDRFRLGSACFHSQKLPATIGVDADRDDDGDGQQAIVAPLVRATLVARPPRLTFG